MLLTEELMQEATVQFILFRQECICYINFPLLYITGTVAGSFLNVVTRSFLNVVTGSLLKAVTGSFLNVVH